MFRSLAEPWAEKGTSSGRLMLAVLGDRQTGSGIYFAPAPPISLTFLLPNDRDQAAGSNDFRFISGSASAAGSSTSLSATKRFAVLNSSMAFTQSAAITRPSFR